MNKFQHNKLLQPKLSKTSSVPCISVNRQRGFSLIESLVAFLILSIGMLGIASLQVVSLKAGHTASIRTVAVFKVEEILERIRNNPTEVLNYVVAAGATGTAKNCNDHGGGAFVSCTTNEMMSDDIYFWKEGLKESLPEGATGEIAVVAPTPGTQPLADITVTIKWKERDTETSTLVDQQYSVTAQVCNVTTC